MEFTNINDLITTKENILLNIELNDEYDKKVYDLIKNMQPKTLLNRIHSKDTLVKKFYEKEIIASYINEETKQIIHDYNIHISYYFIDPNILNWNNSSNLLYSISKVCLCNHSNDYECIYNKKDNKEEHDLINTTSNNE